METAKAINPVRVSYSPQVREALSVSYFGDDAIIEKEIARGSIETWRFGDAVFALRRENIPDDRPELVVVAVGGKNINTALDRVYSFAIENGYGTIRFHTSRPALQRMAKRFNFYEAERVYRARLKIDG